MILVRHDSFQRGIDESLAGAIPMEKEQCLREHLATCAPCLEYLSANNRVIAGLSSFSFGLNPNPKCQGFGSSLAAAHQTRAGEPVAAQPDRRRLTRQRKVQFKVWAAFAVALSLSFAGSALVYRVARF